MTDARPLDAATTIGGRYHLLDVVGRGGMATVYRATDEVLGRQVAVKVLRPEMADDPAFLDQFRGEARAAANVSHARIVAIHDWGQDDHGAYMVMEYLAGPSLRDALRLRGRFSPREALALLEPAAAGIAAAHSAGLVHRDVKPENILLGTDGTVKVTDFGLARAAAAASDPDEREFAASPHYVAPEVVRGGEVGPATDVYSLGIVLYELLTGQRPFDGDSPSDIALAHTRHRVPPPSHAVAQLPAPLDAVVATATAPAPEQRYTDAAAFARALRAAVPGGPAPVDLRDGSTNTVVLPLDVADTVVTHPPAPARRRRLPRPARRTTDDAKAATGSRTHAAHDNAGAGANSEASGRDAAAPQRRRWRPWLLGVTAAAVAAVGALIVWDQVVAPMTDVPSVVGAPQEQAVVTLEEAGFTATVASREHSLEVPVGEVMGQNPRDQARRGSAVRLTVSRGPREHPVPSLAGEEEEAAIERLEELELRPTVDRAYDEEVPQGVVLRTEPEAGTRISEGSALTVVVSRGREPLDVPGVVGRPADEATAELANRGFLVTVTERRYDPDVAEGAVAAQQPPAGETLFRGDEVALVVSRGPEPFPMPDLRGTPEDEARATLEERGIDVEVEYVDTVFPWREGEVDAHDPPPDATVRKGDTVTLYVWQ